MAIFNSLGSNYNLSYVLKALSTVGGSADLKKLNELLEARYGGKSILFYKGREALTYALKLLDLPEDAEIAINGFTCVAVFNAIRQAGFEPICVDLEDTGGLNFTPKNLEKALQKNKKIKVVVVQNTLGFPCEIEKIKAICDKNNLILIEDLAHCVGTKYANGKAAGTVGDMTVLSFSQDKIIDAVSGGAIVVRNTKYTNKNIDINFKEPKAAKDRLYPHFTYKIRSFYNLGIGKPYHFIVKKLGLLSNIMNKDYYNFYKLPAWNASLALFSFKNLNKQLIHRKNISRIYVENLPEKLLMFDKKKTSEAVELSSNLRFPIFLEDRIGLINRIKKSGIYLSDIWYSEVAPECPNAVADSKIILNLPTHINVRESDAKKICDLINKFTSLRESEVNAAI